MPAATTTAVVAWAAWAAWTSKIGPAAQAAERLRPPRGRGPLRSRFKRSPATAFVAPEGIGAEEKGPAAMRGFFCAKRFKVLATAPLRHRAPFGTTLESMPGGASSTDGLRKSWRFPRRRFGRQPGVPPRPTTPPPGGSACSQTPSPPCVRSGGAAAEGLRESRRNSSRLASIRTACNRRNVPRSLRR